MQLHVYEEVLWWHCLDSEHGFIMHAQVLTSPAVSLSLLEDLVCEWGSSPLADGPFEDVQEEPLQACEPDIMNHKLFLQLTL